MYGTSKRLMDLAGGVSNATGMKEFLDKRPTMKSLFESLNVFSSKDSLNLHGIDNAISTLSKIKPESLNNMDDIAKALAQYSKIDVDEYIDALRSAYNKDSIGNAKDFSPEKLDEILNDIKKTKGELDGMLDYKNLQLDGFAEEIKKYATGNNEIYNNLSRESREILEKWSSKTYGEADDILRDLSKVLNEKEVLEGIKNNKIGVSHIDDFVSGFTKIFNAAEGEKGISIFAKAATKLKGGKLLNSLKVVAEGVIKLNPISLITDLVIETIIWIAINNAQEVFTRFLESVQAVDVYPMKKNNKPLIAGMNGHKGSVHGWPVKEGYDSIQGMIMQFIDGIKKLDGNLPFAD